MAIKMKLIYLFIMTLLINVNAAAVILNKEEVEQADLSLLMDETKVFQSIGMGIALSLAQCEGLDLCSLTVEENEIKELLNTLESRVDTLVLKQEEAEDPTEFDTVLTAYMNERDIYNAHLEKLQTITSTLDTDSELLDEAQNLEPDFPVDSARNEELLEYLNDLEAFEDEEIEDDEDLEELPDLPEFEENNSTP